MPPPLNEEPDLSETPLAFPVRSQPNVSASSGPFIRLQNPPAGQADLSQQMSHEHPQLAPSLPQQQLQDPDQAGSSVKYDSLGRRMHWKNGVWMTTAQFLQEGQRAIAQNHTSRPASVSKLTDYGFKRSFEPKRKPEFASHKPAQSSASIAVVTNSSPIRGSGAIPPVTSESGSRFPPRRGRPPANQKVTTGIEIPILTPFKPNQLQRIAQSEPQPKKRGRPFATPEAAARAAAKKAGKRIDGHDGRPEKGAKKRGRPFKEAPKHSEVSVPEATFNIFYCEWEGCQAELHNIQALRSHVFTVHRRRIVETNLIPCLWRSCGKRSEAEQESHKQLKAEVTKDHITETFHMPGSETNSQSLEKRSREELKNSGAKDSPELLYKQPARKIPNRQTFLYRNAWKNHVEENHLIPVLWHQGDGPKGSKLELPSKESQRKAKPWLYENNKQITPSIDDQKVEGGNVRENNQKRFRKKREGAYTIMELIQKPEPSYVKVRQFEENSMDLD